MTMRMIDPAYDELLHAIQPRAIHTKAEHARFLLQIKKFLVKGDDNLSTAEAAMLEVLATLVEDYEKKVYPRTKSTPAELLEFLMEQHNKKAADLPLPSSRVSEILSGRRAISKQQAIELGTFFHVSPALFLGI